MSEAVAFVVPLPPSTNSLFVNIPGKGRARSKAYRAWLEEAGYLLASQRPGSVSGPFSVIVRIPEKARLDLDNAYKAIGDIMVKHRITSDDKLLHKLTIERTPGIASACVSVLPWVG